MYKLNYRLRFLTKNMPVNALTFTGNRPLSIEAMQFPGREFYVGSNPTGVSMFVLNINPSISQGRAKRKKTVKVRPHKRRPPRPKGKNKGQCKP